jgi:ATP-dependent exoDNAse (exonuclease V) beta subunit
MFVQDHSSDIDAFLREWDENIGSKTIQSDVTDGIRILSIHKSKGLEFTHVLIPFCDWRLEMPDVLWCEPNEVPFDALPIAPIDFSSSQMRGTIYEHDYLDEHLQNIVDNLNLLYVAFTRAASSLFVIGQRGSKSNRSSLIEKVLPNLQLDNSTLSGETDEQAPLLFTYGTTAPVASQKGTATTTLVVSPTGPSNPFLAPITPEAITIKTFPAKTEFKQSNKSRDFITGNDDPQEAPSYIKMGCVLHEIFSTIHTTADIDTALRQLQYDGVLYDDEVTANKLTAMLHKRLEDRRIKDWFSDSWQIFNECSILRLNERNEVVERRPDRVMTDGKETLVVDFKFGRPKPEYVDQVREYMQLLQQMGHPNVKGWLWYVYSNKIEEVID